MTNGVSPIGSMQILPSRGWSATKWKKKKKVKRDHSAMLEPKDNLNMTKQSDSKRMEIEDFTMQTAEKTSKVGTEDNLTIPLSEQDFNLC